MKYASLYEFNEAGIGLFRRVFTGALDESAIDEISQEISKPVEGTKSFEPIDFENTREMADAIIRSAGQDQIISLIPSVGLWAWLSFVLRDQVMPKNKQGERKIGEIWRWFPGDANDYQKAQRHLVRMPVLLRATLGENSDHLLCGNPSVPGEIREQMTSQQDMFTPTFQSVARKLYYNEEAGKPKRGAGGKREGSPRRLAKVRLQFDVTWELDDLDTDDIIKMLPKEFDRFLKSA